MNYIELIKKYIPYNEQEEADKNQILKYMSQFSDLLTRENTICHFTSSGFVINKKRDKILMIYHNIYDSWAWTGGHADGEVDFLQVAIKEIKEETWLNKIEPLTKDIFSIEILPVFGHIKRGKYVVAHQHINVTFILEADDKEAVYIKEDENSDVKWIDINKIKEYSTEVGMYPVYDKIIEKMKKNSYI